MPETWSSGSLTHGQAYHKTSSMKLEKVVTCISESERTSLWTSDKTRNTFCRTRSLSNATGQTLKSALFRAINSLPKKTCYVLCHFRCGYLKANKVSKTERTRNRFVLSTTDVQIINWFKHTNNRNKCVNRTDTNPPFAFQTAFPGGTDFSVSTGRVKKLHTLLVSLYF